MAKKPTVHNPTNFEPSHYEVVDYLDNKRPPFYGQTSEEYALEVKWFQENMLRTFGANWRAKIHHCVHCGNGNVRWITAVRHQPTGEVVVFGADCTERLGFANQMAFKLAQLKSKAEAGHARMKIWNLRTAFLATHPEVADAVEQLKNPVHAKNLFAQDVLAKLNLYGSLSERQIAAVLSSLARDIQNAARRAVEATVTGVVLSMKEQATDFGVVTKMLMKLENNAKVWLTCPAKAEINRTDTVTITATFERSKDDPSFSFGKRPVVVNVTVVPTPFDNAVVRFHTGDDEA
jgi:hypothetical protein